MAAPVVDAPLGGQGRNEPESAASQLFNTLLADFGLKPAPSSTTSPRIPLVSLDKRKRMAPSPCSRALETSSEIIRVASSSCDLVSSPAKRSRTAERARPGASGPRGTSSENRVGTLDSVAAALRERRGAFSIARAAAADAPVRCSPTRSKAVALLDLPSSVEWWRALT